ncbi:MAG: DUF2283 domain-containing protein [Pseudomonadota bacterium]
MWVDYDKEADVLYISCKRPQRATDSEMLDNGVRSIQETLKKYPAILYLNVPYGVTGAERPYYSTNILPSTP